MHITNDIKPVTYLKAKAADLLDQINNVLSVLDCRRNVEDILLERLIKRA